MRQLQVATLAFLLHSGAVFAARSVTLTFTSSAVPPNSSLQVSRPIESHHIDIFRMVVHPSDLGSTMNRNSRFQFAIYRRNSFLPQDRLYQSLLGSNDLVDPDGAVKVEDFLVPYDDADPGAHPPTKELHMLLTNDSNQSRSFVVTIAYQVVSGATGSLDVRQFGAVGDGVADDTDAVQRAINEGVASQRNVFLPGGRYRITSSLTFNQPSLTRNLLSITGIGAGSEVINQAPAGNPTLVLLGKQQFHVSKLAIVGRPAFPNDAIFIGAAGDGSRSAYGSLSDLDLYPNGNGIHLQAANSVTIDRVRYHMGATYSFDLTGANLAAFKHAVLADGPTAVNEIYVDSLFATGYASIADGGAAVKWNTSPATSTGMRVNNSSLEGVGKRAIEMHNVFFFSIADNFLERAETTLENSRHGYVQNNDGGIYKVGDGTAAGACAYVTFVGTSGESFEADEHNGAIRVMGGLFDIGGYDNRSADRVSISVYGAASVSAGDELGAAGIRERGRDAPMGEWTAPAFDAAFFSADSGNWVVDSSDVTTFAYTLVGKTMTINFFLGSTTVTNATANLRLRIPGDYRAKRRATALGTARNAGGVATNLTMQVVPAVGEVFLFRGNLGSLGDWQASMNDNDLTGSISFEVE